MGDNIFLGDRDGVRTPIGRYGGALASVRADDLAAVMRADAFRPLADTAADLTRLQGVTGTARALHLLPLVDGPATARQLANAAEALGPSRLIAGVDLAGPARMLRATVRMSDAALQFAAAVFAFFVLVAQLVVGLLKSFALRLARRGLRAHSGFQSAWASSRSSSTAGCSARSALPVSNAATSCAPAVDHSRIVTASALFAPSTESRNSCHAAIAREIRRWSAKLRGEAATAASSAR